MKKIAVLISIFLLSIPVVALAKSGNGDGSKAKSEERAKQAKKSCEAELKVVGENNFKELYGKGDDRTGAMSQCQKIKQNPPHHGKRGKRGGPPGGPFGKCLKESGVDRDASAEDKKAAASKCETEHKKKREEMESKRLAFLKSCVDEQADDQSAFNSKYTLVGEENQAEHTKRLEEYKAKLAENGKSTKRVDKELKRLETADVRPFRACDRSNMKELIEQERGSKDGNKGPGSRNGQGGPGLPGPGGSGGPEESGDDGFGGPPPGQI